MRLKWQNILFSTNKTQTIMNKQDKYQAEKDAELAIIKAIGNNQEIFKKLFQENNSGVEDILFSMATLFNTFIDNHELNDIFLYTNRKLYIKFSKLISAVRRGIEIFKHEMAYKSIQAPDSIKFLNGEKEKISYKFKDKNRYTNILSLIDGEATFILSEVLTPIFFLDEVSIENPTRIIHYYEATIEKLTFEFDEKKDSLREIIDTSTAINRIWLLSRIQLFVDIYSFFHIRDLLAKHEQNEDSKEDEHEQNKDSKEDEYEQTEQNDTAYLKNIINAKNESIEISPTVNVYDKFSSGELAIIYYFDTLVSPNRKRKNALTLLFRNKVTNFEDKHNSVDSAFRRIRDRKENERNDFFKDNYLVLEKITISIEDSEIKSRMMETMNTIINH